MAASILFAIILINALLFVIAVSKVRNSGEKFIFTYAWSALIGAFVWVDVVVFSAFFMLAALVTLFVRDIRVGLLLLGCFWIVRSAGEVLYEFLQQFHRPTHHPHDLEPLFGPLRKLFGNIDTQKCYIIMQIIWQVVLTVALAGTILLILHWQTIPAWGLDV